MPVETKVQASAAAAAVSGLVLWVLGRYVFAGNVPDVIASWIYAVVPALLAFAAGWAAKHTVRPGDLAAVAAPAAAPAAKPPMSSLPPAGVTRPDPAQVPAVLMSPATDAGQPPEQPPAP